MDWTGDYFGELALIKDQRRAANVVAVGPITCLMIERADFELLLGPLSEILKVRCRDRKHQAHSDQEARPLATVNDIFFRAARVQRNAEAYKTFVGA
jgi:CRP-like cAMP-binding protein